MQPNSAESVEEIRRGPPPKGETPAAFGEKRPESGSMQRMSKK